MLRLIGVVLLSVTVGCASTTQIRSVPSGATVKSIEGGTLGVTPLFYSDTNIVNQPKQLTLELAGYEPTPLIIKRDQWDPGRLVLFVVGGLFLFVPYVGLLWSADYSPAYEVQLKPSNSGVAPSAPNVPL